jgi:hypothetical protein
MMRGSIWVYIWVSLNARRLHVLFCILGIHLLSPLQAFVPLLLAVHSENAVYFSIHETFTGICIVPGSSLLRRIRDLGM